jgi:glycosyltransferase involved in cell wall biosynthesis
MAQVLRDQRMNYDIDIWSRGVDREVFHPGRRDMEWRRAHGIADDEVAIGFLGRLVMEKGLDVFSDAIDELNRRGVAHKVLVIGEGPARPWFEARLPGASFAGFQAGSDLGRAVASMDVLLNPSVTETFGNVTLEAMACGVPVVATDVGGNAEVICRADLGSIVPFDDHAALLAALRDALRRDWDREAIRRYAEENDWNTRVPVLVGEFRRIATANGGRAGE